MAEFYASRMNPAGGRTVYRSRAAYVQGRSQASATMAATRARINRSVGGRIL